MQETAKRFDTRKAVKYGAVGLAVAAGLAVLGTALGRSAKAENAPPEEKSFRVKVMQVQPEGNDVFLEYTGLVQPAELMQCTFSTIGTIDAIHVKEGDEVVKGQLLATLKADDANRQQENMQQLANQTDQAVTNAKSALEQAKRDYEAACVPADADALSKAREERDRVRSDRDTEKANLEKSKAQLEQDKAAVSKAQSDYDQVKGPVEQAQQNRDKAFNTAQKDAAEVTMAAAQLSQAQADAASAEGELAAAQAEQAAAQEALASLEAADPSVQDPAAIEEARARLAQADSALSAATEKNAAAAAALTDAQNRITSAKTAAEASAQALQLAEAQLVSVRAESGIDQYEKDLAKAKAQMAQSEGTVTAAQTRLTALEADFTAKQARVDALSSKGPNSAEAKLQKQRLDAAESALSAAESAQLTAQNGYESAQSNVADMELKAPADGYVVKVVGTEGGMAAPIAPAVVLGSKKASVQFGVSQDDVRKIAVGSGAQVTVGDKEYAGTISNIGTMPDPTTRTYMVSVDILADSGDFYLGEMAEVKLEAGERKGAWLPLSCVLNDGEDYVYVAENGRSVRRVVRILDVSDDKLLVSGLETGSSVIVEGMKTVRSGSAVLTE